MMRQRRDVFVMAGNNCQGFTKKRDFWGETGNVQLSPAVNSHVPCPVRPRPPADSVRSPFFSLCSRQMTLHVLFPPEREKQMCVLFSLVGVG